MGDMRERDNYGDISRDEEGTPGTSRENRNRRVNRIAFVLLVLILWELVPRLSGISPLLFPPLSRVLETMAEDFLAGTLSERIGFSLLIIFEGVFLALVLALLLSLGSLVGRGMAVWVDTLVVLMHPLPGIALLPILILWAGTGRTAVLWIIVHSVLWPLSTSIVAGIRTIPQHLYDVSRNFNLRLHQRLLHLIIPGALPHLLSGLRIGWARAWRALIAAEMVFGAAGGSGGLGWYIFQKRVFMDSQGLFAGILLIMGIGILFEELFFEALEKISVKKWGGAS